MRTTTPALCAAALFWCGTARAQTWESVPAIPAPGGKVHAAAVSAGGTIYALGGTPWINGGDMDGSVHTLVPGSMAWQTEIGLEGLGPVTGHGAGVDGLGRIVVFGGENIDNDDAGPTKVYDPAEGPTTSLPMRPTLAPSRWFASCTDDQGRIYSIGGGQGREAVPGEGNIGYACRYVASTNSWQTIAPLPLPVGDAAAVYDGNGHILVIGGVLASGGARSPNVARYDIAANTWSDTAIADLPVGVSGHRAVVGANGWVYVFGGESGELLEPTMLDTVWIYRPDLDAWHAGPPMADARRYHAAVLGPDDYIYVFGGEDDVGGLASAERIYTPPCPTMTTQPQSAVVWALQSAAFSATVAGGLPIELRWLRDGLALTDGPAPGGGTISGSDTLNLVITDVADADAGLYELVATNDCGVTTSTPATLTIRHPPSLPTRWNVTNLHPAGMLRSHATDVDGDAQVGIGGLDTGGYSNLDQPVLWHGTSESAMNLTPPASVGGGILAIGGDTAVGWWWWPYQCHVSGQWYTCYSRQASEWSLSTGQQFNRQVSGWEYSVINDTDGTTHVGTATTDDEVGNVYSRASIWGPPGYWSQFIHPVGVSNSFLSAVDEGRQFGSIHTPFPGPVPRAAMWSGTAGSYVDMHPPGYSTSGIAGAGDGQAVGSTGWYAESHAALWAFAPGTHKDLHPAGATTSSAVDCEGGLQVGTASIGGVSRAILWAGSAAEFLDLHAFAPPQFTSSTASALDVADDGTITVVGSGYNAVTGRLEALMWRSTEAVAVGDFDNDGDTDLDDYAFLAVCLAGPGTAPPDAPPVTAEQCRSVFDLDADQDVDLRDASMFLQLAGG
jgi:hypothetical protein